MQQTNIKLGMSESVLLVSVFEGLYKSEQISPVINQPACQIVKQIAHLIPTISSQLLTSQPPNMTLASASGFCRKNVADLILKSYSEVGREPTTEEMNSMLAAELERVNKGYDDA